MFASCYFCVCIYSLSLFFISSTKTNRYRPYKLRSGSFTVCLSLQGMDQCSLSTRRTLPSGIVWLRSTCCPCARMSQLLAGDNCHLEFRFDLYTLRLRKKQDARLSITTSARPISKTLSTADCKEVVCICISTVLLHYRAKFQYSKLTPHSYFLGRKVICLRET